MDSWKKRVKSRTADIVQEQLNKLYPAEKSLILLVTEAELYLDEFCFFSDWIFDKFLNNPTFLLT